jgi:hypothetical protein
VRIAKWNFFFILNLLAEHSIKHAFWQMVQIDDVVVLWELQNETFSSAPKMNKPNKEWKIRKNKTYKTS